MQRILVPVGYGTMHPANEGTGSHGCELNRCVQLSRSSCTGAWDRACSCALRTSASGHTALRGWR
jgi:hypothetical protein